MSLELFFKDVEQSLDIYYDRDIKTVLLLKSTFKNGMQVSRVIVTSTFVRKYIQAFTTNANRPIRINQKC